MKIETGKGQITLLTLISIWALSLVVNIPGLAVTPLLGVLDKIFPGTSELEIQLLTVVPNLVIIPFVLLSGKLAESGHKITIVRIALLIYLASGILYIFASTMLELILLGIALGIGCGLIIPLAAALLADTFTGKYRLQQLGIKSGIANLALVAATFIVGWLTGENWRLPFLVYLIPIIPLALSPFLNGIKTVEIPQTTFPTTTLAENASEEPKIGAPDVTTSGERVYKGFILSRLWGVMLFYFIICLAAVTMVYYLPFLMQEYGISTTEQGIITALFFLAIFLPGVLLGKIVKILKNKTTIVALGLMAVGVLMMGIFRGAFMLGVSVFITGWGYGIAQPVIYDKTVQTVTNENKATLALSFVLAINYLSITVAPFIFDGIAYVFGQSHNNHFAFYLNAVVTAVYAVVGVFLINRSTFSMSDEYI